jgi:drug/metabolite transporter (DMT)-like permease
MLVTGVCAGFGQLAMTRAYALDQAARVGAVGYLAVVVSALLGALALGEVPDALATIGMLLVIAGGLVTSLRRASS